MTSIIKRAQLNRPLTCSEYDQNLDATLERANHIGSQSATTIYDLQPTVKQFDFIKELEACCTNFSLEINELREDLFGQGEITNLLNSIRQEFLQEINTIISNNAESIQKISSLEKYNTTLNQTLNTINQVIEALSNSKANLESPSFTGIPKAPTPSTLNGDNVIATIGYVRQFALPVGTILPYAGSTPPDNTWMLCQGQRIRRNSHRALFAVIGLTYSTVPDSNDFFNIPNLSNRIPIGVGQTNNFNYTLGSTGGQEKHQLSTAEIPSHKHNIIDYGHSHGVNDPGHSHSVNDPGHAHGLNLTMGGADGSGIGKIATNTDRSADLINQDPTSGSGTNISINGSGTNISVNPSASNIDSEVTGGNQPFSLMPPFISLNYIIKIF